MSRNLELPTADFKGQSAPRWEGPQPRHRPANPPSAHADAKGPPRFTSAFSVLANLVSTYVLGMTVLEVIQLTAMHTTK